MRARDIAITCLFMGAFFVSACSQTPPPIPVPVAFQKPSFSDAEAVWRGATLALPVRGSAGSMITTNDGGLGLLHLAGAKPKTTWPVIVMLAGCGQRVSPQLMRAFAEQGFVAFALDSKARHFEPVICDPTADVHVRAAQITRFKQAELSYAIRELQAVPWVDQKNIFLLGLGAGSAAVAQAPRYFSKARILAEWDCGGGPEFGGLKDELSSPVFVATSGGVFGAAGSDCATHMKNIAESQSLKLPASYPNGILLEPIVFTQMLQFLDRQLFK